MHANRSDLLQNSVLILHDNARPHVGKVVCELLDRYSWEVLPHPSYSSNMSPPDFDLFPKLKINVRGVRFSTLGTYLRPLPDASDSSNVLQT